MPNPPVNPLLIDIPDSFTTERLLIRCPRPGDGAFMAEAIRESHDRLRPWLPWAKNVPTVEESEAVARRAWVRYQERSDLALRAFLRDTGEFVAASGLHRIDWNVPKFEIGYWVRTKYEGRGLMTEAVNGVARFALETLGANRVEIRCDPRNARSAAVAERCGFTLESRVRNDLRDVEGRLRDTLVYVRVPEAG
jgi:RimJ/RimL family protein N-acetyltransferase